MNRLFATDDGWTGIVLRVGLAVVMFPHGAQKLLGWFGGPGLTTTMTVFTSGMHLPAFVAALVIAVEVAGPVGLFVGALTRIAALGIACEMVGAVALVHWPNGFFMNWMGKQAGEGFEYHILMITIAVAIMITGAGRWSVDRAVQKRERARPGEREAA